MSRRLPSWLLLIRGDDSYLPPHTHSPLNAARRGQVLMYTAMKSIFEDKNRQEALFVEGPGKDLDVRTHTRTPKYSADGVFECLGSDCDGPGHTSDHR